MRSVSAESPNDHGNRSFRATTRRSEQCEDYGEQRAEGTIGGEGGVVITAGFDNRLAILAANARQANAISVPARTKATGICYRSRPRQRRNGYCSAFRVLWTALIWNGRHLLAPSRTGTPAETAAMTT
jgi:hypothetical protein